jgi:hypothetical protein
VPDLSPPADPARWGRVFVSALTAIHATGSAVLVGMLAFVLADPTNAERLARTPGARLLVDWTGPWLPAFFAALAAFLGALAWSSRRRQPWAWRGAVAAYSIGVLGSAWEVSIGIAAAWLSVAINAAVVAMLLAPATRAVYFGRRGRG